MLKEGKSLSNTLRNPGVGALAGYFGRQSKASRRREEEIAPGGTPVLAGRKLSGSIGREVADERAAKIGPIVHRSLGVAYGITAAARARGGVPPVRAGLAVGAAAFLLVDDGFVGMAFAPLPWAYPVERGL